MHNKSILGGVLDLELKNNVFDEISEVAYYRIKSEKSKRIFLLGQKINRRKQKVFPSCFFICEETLLFRSCR